MNGQEKEMPEEIRDYLLKLRHQLAREIGLKRSQMATVDKLLAENSRHKLSDGHSNLTTDNS